VRALAPYRTRRAFYFRRLQVTLSASKLGARVGAAHEEARPAGICLYINRRGGCPALDNRSSIQTPNRWTSFGSNARPPSCRSKGGNRKRRNSVRLSGSSDGTPVPAFSNSRRRFFSLSAATVLRVVFEDSVIRLPGKMKSYYQTLDVRFSPVFLSLFCHKPKS
jgi:hypothetical protein